MWGFNNFSNLGGSSLKFLWVWPWVFIFVVVDLILRAYALWYSARRGQKVWFIALLIINSMGILPLIYLFLNRKSKKK